MGWNKNRNISNMNKALEGNNEEVLITKIFNQKSKYWNSLPYDQNVTFAIHIIGKKYGKINQEKIQPKADVFFAEGNIEIDFLIKNDFYLNESHIEQFNLTPILFSGLSIKLPNSKYTITKISPNTFYKIFNNNILGAGASIYSTKEFEKNESVIKGWLVDIADFEKFFCQNLNINRVDLYDQEIMSKIKSYSNKEIEKLIIQDEVVSDLIFKGIGNFEEPFTANWILENDELKENYYIPFIITTGSGRSKNNFTVVLKPK
jgi:hypothetical protein